MNKKNIILFINNVNEESLESIKEYEKRTNQQFVYAVIYDTKRPPGKLPSDIKKVFSCNLNKTSKIIETLKDYQDRILAIICRGDVNIPELAKLVPYIPYVRTPTKDSLLWAIDKIHMRSHLTIYDKEISPKYLVIKDKTKATIKKIKEEVGFPLIIKPARLASSLLVTICYHEEELNEYLNKIFKKIKKIYKENNRVDDPQILVEEFMEGDMYSIDGYVTSRGDISFCPMVYIKTGKRIGFDDFFGYQQMTPTKLKKSSIAAAEEVAVKAIRALGLRSTTVHIEFIKTEEGFKVIELAPRMGGFRHSLYNLSQGIDHSLNDFLVRLPKKINLPKKGKGYAAAFKFFAKKEGKLTKLLGLKKIKKLDSFIFLKRNKEIGDMCLYAKNGGQSVFNLVLFNKERSDLLADIRRAEKNIKIVTEK